MKLKQTAAILIAAATAVIPFTSSTASPFKAPSAVYADSASALAELPDWIPDDFDSAVEFRNTYGATHIGNGLICIVYPERVRKGRSEDTYGYELQASGDIGQILKHEIYSHEYTETCYDVFVYQPLKQGDHELKIVDPHVQVKPSPEEADADWEPPVVAEYTFTADNALQITETDIYSWLPDCMTEFGEYERENGEVSVKDNYIVFCTTTIDQFGDNWNPDSSNKYENIKYCQMSDCTMEVRDMYVDGSIDTVYVYQAVKDGHEKISFVRTSRSRPDQPDGEPKVLTADCMILDDAQTVLLQNDAKVTILDNETGKPIEITKDSGFALYQLVNELPTPIIAELDSNPCILRGISYPLDESIDLKMPGEYERPMIEGTFLTDENYYKVTKYENGACEAVFRLNNIVDLEPGQTRITLYDKDTGELIPSQWLKNHRWGFGTDIRYKRDDVPGGWMYTGPICIVDSNPCLYTADDLAGLYKSADYFGFVCDDQPTVKLYKNGSIDIIFNTKFKLTGNVNGDGNFNIADVVTLQKWLLNDPDVVMYDWWQGDFDFDDQLTAFDLCLMKQELIEKPDNIFVEPDEKVEYGIYGRVIADGLKMYMGPDESYGVITSIPKGPLIRELGYQHNNELWMYTEYDGKNGWVRIFEQDNVTPTLFFEEVAAKPVIYLYPEEETDVHVELELTEADLSTTYPKYNNGWDVTAYPDGTLLNKADGTHHRYLFWDAVNCRTRFDFSKGFCVAGCDTESFLREKLKYMGLTEDEMNEFIVYWLPLMEHNKFNLISFQGDVYTASAKLNITPAPDSILRIFMAYVPLEEAVDIEPQQLETFERKGFTVVEWGGSKMQ